MSASEASTPVRRRPRPVSDAVIEKFLQDVGYQGLIDARVRARYASLVRRAGKPGLPRWLLAVSLVRRDPDLSPPSGRVFEAESQRRREAAAKRRALAASLMDEQTEDAARSFVQHVRQQTGQGPTWRELGRHLGWSNAQTKAGVHELRRRGVVAFTSEHRSLHVPERLELDRPDPSGTA